ncbi:hypothetical protein [Kitasatospora sp. NPDC096204]|uniref:hypothetical protein n=1 Tax=Kitasatospora sp. NPDC096204 TaxID=3364094 RepID=UPI0037FA2712
MHRHRAVGIVVLILVALGTASACDADKGGDDQPASPTTAPTTAATAPPHTATPPLAAATSSPAPMPSLDVENPSDLVHDSAASPTRPAGGVAARTGVGGS